MSQKTTKTGDHITEDTDISDAPAVDLMDELAPDLSGNETAESSEVTPAGDFESDSREDLIGKLIEARNQIDEMNDSYIRSRAEVENVRRRSQNEMIAARKYAIEGFAQELLSVLDSLDQAARVEMDESNADAVVKMKEGLELTLKQFDKVMEKFGVTGIEAGPGVKFNPELHQAISMVASDEVEPEHILNVMQKGFMLKDRLLRPAMVVIAKGT